MKPQLPTCVTQCPFNDASLILPQEKHYQEHKVRVAPAGKYLTETSLIQSVVLVLTKSSDLGLTKPYHLSCPKYEDTSLNRASWDHDSD